MSLPLPRTMLATVFALLFGAAGVRAADDQWVYFGTYTDGMSPTGSKGIYLAQLDAATGKLGTAVLVAEMDNPSFLAAHPNGKVLYAVGESGGKDGGPVVAFKIDPKTGGLTKLNEVKSRGDGPCHISVHPNGHYLAVANYVGGSSAVFELGSDGKIGNYGGFAQHKGSSIDKDRQKGPHAHCVQFFPNGQYILAADLGADRVFVMPYNAGKGSLHLSAGNSDVTLLAGTGPRHLALAKDGKFGYVCGELNSTVNVIEFGWAEGNKVVQSLITVPADKSKGNSTAECLLSPNEKFVYVSNRGHNSVAVFKVGEDRKLTAAGHITGDIKTPRNFGIDPSGKWMLVASQEGAKVGVWELNADTGLGKETGKPITVSKPVCVKFVPVPK